MKKKQIKKLVFLVGFTSILLIMTTYAWFTTQKNVTIGNLEGIVKVVEGLRISLDAKNWSSSIDFSQYTDQTDLKNIYGTVTGNGDHNIIPTELLPVSTLGSEEIGIGNEIKFYRGTNLNQIKLENVKATAVNKTNNDGNLQETTAVTDPDIYPGYYAIDMFLENSSVETTGDDILQLDIDSNVTIPASGNSNVGLENTPRVAFALYTSDTSVGSVTVGKGETTQESILAATTGEKSKIEDVTIWEPNANSHIDYIVTNNNKITWSANDKLAYGIGTTNKFTKNQRVPTYALKASSVGKVFENIYNWDGTTITDIGKQITLQTDTEDVEKHDLLSVNTEESVVEPIPSGTAMEFKIPKAQVCRLRMYIWLEGQDVDCTSLASHGGKIQFNIGLTKKITEDEEKGNITFSNIIWRENKASVKMTNHSSNTMQYKIIGENDTIDENDQTGWTEVTNRTEIINDLKLKDRIVARLYDGEEYSQYATCVISDNKKPVISIETTEVTTKSIKIKANAIDNESGLADDKPYKYYIAKSLDQFANESGNNKTGEFKFDNLESNVTYYIKVEREDVVGNLGSSIKQVQLLMVTSAEEGIIRNIEWEATTDTNNAKAQISLETKTEYTIKYGSDRENKSNWKDYTERISVTNGDRIYIALTDGINYGLDYEIIAEDKEGPKVNIKQNSSKANTIAIKVNAEDAGAGMPENAKYSYYIRKDGESNYELKAEEITANTYQFTDLEASQNYNIKVTTTDKIGNVGEGTITTNSLYTNDIQFSNLIWRNSKARITMNNDSDDYDMEYKINDDTNWTKTIEKSIDVGALKEGDVITSRLTDGVNTSINISLTISNSAKKDYTETELSKIEKKQYNILGVQVNKNTIKVQIDKEVSEAISYQYYYKTLADSNYKLAITNTYYNDSATITDLEENTIYKIKIVAVDKSGRTTTSQNSVTAITLEQAQTNTTYAGNRTYIDNSTTLKSRIEGENGYGENPTLENITAGYTISVPSGFKVSSTTGENTQERGVVLKDNNNNEFVWIPVNNAIYDNNTRIPTNATMAQGNAYKPMAIKQTGYSNYYEGLIYEFNGVVSYKNINNTGIGKSSYREPSLITGNNSDGYTWDMKKTIGTNNDAKNENYNTILGFSSTQEMGEYILNSYNSMISSVDLFGGFYVGRYETTQTKDSSNNIIVGSKTNNAILSGYNWYNLYLYQDNKKYNKNPYYANTSVVSSMIWGSQYDAMLNYILSTTESNKVTSTIGRQKNQLSNSAQDTSDIIDNIYDLGSNANEWTQEATENNKRVYRGGGYDKSVTGASPMSRKGIEPVNSGLILGSRMQLYIKSTNDKTPPTVTIENKTSTTNKISISANAIDKESAINKFSYFVKESSDPNDSVTWTKTGESQTNNYTYTGLKQNTTYSIKITATDEAGNESSGTLDTITTKKLGNIANEKIEVKSKFGENGDGTIRFKQKDTTYEQEGYYIQTQVLDKQASANDFVEANWKTGDTVTGLSDNKYIYVTLFDGVNRTPDKLEVKVTGLDEFVYYTDKNGNSSQNTTVTYVDSDGNTATIPAGFKVSTGETSSKVNDGLVVRDPSDNEFVWIPVPVVIETNKSTSSSEKAMSRVQTGNTKYYEGILYNFTSTGSSKQRNSTAIGTTANREPSLITYGKYTWNIEEGTASSEAFDTQSYYNNFSFGANVFKTYTEYGQYMNEEYTNMTNSVNKYKGFYVGRYETSTIGNDFSLNAVTQVKKGTQPLYDRNWYMLYYYQDSNFNNKNPYSSIASVTSSMIWGSQWDAMLNWIQNSKDEESINVITGLVGNRSGSKEITGKYTDDLSKNIFDLSANVREWTQEANGEIFRNLRGGSYLKTTDKYGKFTSLDRAAVQAHLTYISSNPSNSGYDGTINANGTRMALYINNTNDKTAPIIDENATTVEKGNNNIKIKIQAQDSESGIKNYKYTISTKDYSASDFSEQYIISTVESKGWSCVFERLAQNTPYYIKVEVSNGVGLTSTYYSGQVVTEILNLIENPASLDKVYGKSTEGVAYLKLAQEYLNSKYKIQYQILTGSDLPTDNNWKDATDVKGLSGYVIKELKTGDIIYTRITDTTNNSQYFKTATISELETYSEKVKNANYVYTDQEGNTAKIPVGFKYGTSSLNNTISNGLVVEDEAGNQYVWIPVKNAIYDGKTTIATSNNSSTYKPLARVQQGYSSDNYEGMLYSYSGTKSYIMDNSTDYRLGKSGYREPSLVTDSTINNSWQYTSGTLYDATNYKILSNLKNATINSPTALGQYMNSKFTEMVKSVDTNKGFYVGRYETSSWNAGQSANAENTGTIVKTVANATPMASTNWYNMYLKSDSNYESNPYYNNSSVTSCMIWGCQYDAMLNYVLQGTDKSKVTTVTGNHSETRALTGQYPTDIMSNIFDLSSNVREWTQEAYSFAIRAYRGGGYGAADRGAAGHRSYYYFPTDTVTYFGSRLALYLK